MHQPLELIPVRPMHLHGGQVATTADVWAMLDASQAGDIGMVTQCVAACPALATCQYDYTAPLHLAVREGHERVVRFLVEQRALDPTYRNHPFQEPLPVMARDRGHHRIADYLERVAEQPEQWHAWGDTGAIERGRSARALEFEHAVDHGRHTDVEAMLHAEPGLARDPDAFWGEGILAMPAKDGDVHMVDVLMSFGATVPRESKWGARYYLKRTEMAQYLLARGMHPDHRNWRQFTVLHDMAFSGDTGTAVLLLRHGAQINLIDEEYQSTPLGYAAHFGRVDMVRLLLDHGADVTSAGAPWATPLAWAHRRGYKEIETMLRDAGAPSRSDT
jgi:uncharacterized protein